MSLRSKLRFVGLSDTGKVREHNEDTIAVDADIGLLVLADGSLLISEDGNNRIWRLSYKG